LIVDRYGAYSAWTTATQPDTPAFLNLRKYFKSDDKAARDRITDVFIAIFSECCAPITKGGRYRCSDCSNVRIGGFTSVRRGVVVYCDAFFKSPTQCKGRYKRDQPLIMMHELSHALAGTKDEAYVWENFFNLNSGQALDNADTYAYFAKAVSSE